MTVTVGRRSLSISWPITTTAIIFLIYTTWKGTSFIDNIIQTQQNMQKELAVIAARDSVYQHKVDQNSTAIQGIKPQVSTMNTRLDAMEEVMPPRLRIRYYNEVKTKTGIAMVPATN